MLGEDREGGSLLVGKVVVEFNESVVGTFEVISESWVGDLISEEMEESEGVLVSLEVTNIEEISGASSIELGSEIFVVLFKGVLSIVDVGNVLSDFFLKVVDGGFNIIAMLVLSIIKSLDVGDVIQKGILGGFPVLFKFIKIGLRDVEEGSQELNNGVNSVTGLDQTVDVLGDKTGSLGVDLSHS